MPPFALGAGLQAASELADALGHARDAETARRRLPVGFYLTAMLFIVFDIEAIFVYPWAVMLRQLQVRGLVEMAVFVGALALTLLYVWRKGALEWE